MALKRDKLEREKKTLLAMLRIYCRNHHGSTGKQLCPDCRQLREYADQRLQKCPFGAEKGPCSQCEIHCYKPEMRERIRDVMRYSGPRMLSSIPFWQWPISLKNGSTNPGPLRRFLIHLSEGE